MVDQKDDAVSPQIIVDQIMNAMAHVLTELLCVTTLSILDSRICIN